MWWDQKKELLKDYEGKKDLDGFLDDQHFQIFPLRARHFFLRTTRRDPARTGRWW